MARHIGFRLVIIVIGNKIRDRVLREEFLELGIELRGKRLIVRHDQRRLLQLLDDGRNREGLAGAGRAEQDLVLFPGADSFDESADRFGLVAHR